MQTSPKAQPIQPIGDTPLLPGTLKNLFYPPEKNEYTYFARAKEKPFLNASTVVRGAWAADAAMLAYARYGATPMPVSDFTGHLAGAGLSVLNLIGDWKAPGTQGYFAVNDQYAFLSFRGTEVDDKVKQFDDVDIVLVHEPDYQAVPGHPQSFLAHLSLVEHLVSAPCFVHQGFQRALNSVWDEVHACVTTYRQSHPEGEVCFTGHSLGAALAVLAFSRLADSNASLLTFGCPRVGNDAFQKRVLSQPGKGIVRFVNLNDPVAHVPLESFLYRQVPGVCLRFDAKGNLAEDDGSFLGDAQALAASIEGLPPDLSDGLDKINAPIGVVDHSPARYCIRLWNCV
jgi:Lipase (class 3)